MITDLAPIDLVLQRAGRLHRHPRNRPEAHREALLHVAGLTGDEPPDLDATRWKYVYQPYILLRSWQQLRAQPIIRLPGDIDPLVQAVYDDEGLDDMAGESSAYDQAFGEYVADRQEMQQRMQNVALAADAPDLFTLIDTQQAREAGEGGLEVVTRLGEASLAVVPLWADARGWRERPDAPPFDPQRPLERERARSVYARQLRVSRKALVKALQAQPKPPAFAESPYLRDLFPLLLDDESKTNVGTLQARLDARLGLVYTKEAT
jgi:CRISPR-associated endonuclease/helicase Cas3